jgi:uncharacterized protein (TIGR02145 family)
MNQLKLMLSAVLFLSLNTATLAQTVTIGTQVWTTRNLNVTTFRNGDSIPHAKTNEEWQLADSEKQPAWCYYDNDPANGAKYGILYNWYAVNDQRGLAPDGFHIPTDAEWTTLTTFLGGEDFAGKTMKSKSGLDIFNDSKSCISENKSNKSSILELRGACRFSDGNFSILGDTGNWWSSTELDSMSAFDRWLYYNLDNVTSNVNSKGVGCSVRCVKD